MAYLSLTGSSIYFIALIIVQAILMGATIDYGILFTNYYTEHRRDAGVFEAVRKAYEGAIHTITTSGLILVIVPSIVGRFFQDPTITAIVDTIGIGSLVAILLILVFLPGILITCDKLVARKRR
jgi:predicted RND superfamily exporter protein